MRRTSSETSHCLAHGPASVLVRLCLMITETRLWFCSTGYLVRLVAAHPQALKTHTHIIVDEVHERSVDTEILCLLLRRLVQEHPTIRVVLMSATVCVDLYASYFHVDPRTSSLHVGARRFPVTEFYADDIVDSLRLPENLHSKAQRLVLHTGERPPHAAANPRSQSTSTPSMSTSSGETYWNARPKSSDEP